MEISTAHCFLFTVALFCINLPVRKSKESSPTRGNKPLSIVPLHAARSDSVKKKCTCPVPKWCHLIVTPADRRNSCREKLTRFDHLRVREKSFLRQTSRTMRKVSNWHLISSRAPQFRNSRRKTAGETDQSGRHLDAHATQVKRWKACWGSALRIDKAPSRWPLQTDFSHAYQSQVYRPCVIHILPQFSLISFGSWYSGIWHIDHICFAIWIWDWFHEYVSYSVSLSFMLYFFLQYTFDQIKAISLRSKEQSFFSLSLFLSMLGWCWGFFPANERILQSRRISYSA